MAFYPSRRDTDIVLTSMMAAAKRRTFAIHKRGGLVVWSGESHVGKTTTAEWLEREINDRYDPENKDAFCATHFEVAEMGRRSGGHTKKALRTLYHRTLGRLDEGTYRSERPEDLAQLIIHGLKLRRREMIFVDEAGLYSPEALRALVLVSDWAKKLGFRLTLVLIGMDNLERSIRQIVQIDRRVGDWICFETPSEEETFQMLRLYSPLFEDRDPEDEETAELVKWIHDRHSGLPGSIMHFMDRVESKIGKRTLNLRFLNVVYQITSKDRARIRKVMKGGGS